MKISTLISSTLLICAMGIGMAGTAQADGGYYGHGRDSHRPLHDRHHDRHHRWGLHRKALQNHHGHHREHKTYYHDRCAGQDRHQGRHDHQDDDHYHRSSYWIGVGYTGRL